jgi:hypothetical protein
MELNNFFRWNFTFNFLYLFYLITKVVFTLAIRSKQTKQKLFVLAVKSKSHAKWNSNAKISEEKVCCMYLVPTLHHLDCDWFSTWVYVIWRSSWHHTKSSLVQLKLINHYKIHPFYLIPSNFHLAWLFDNVLFLNNVISVSVSHR